MIPGRDENDYSTFVLRSAASPSQIEMTDRDGNLMRGIYRFKGDVLTLCLARAGADRPNEFESTSACRCYLIEMKRRPPAASAR